MSAWRISVAAVVVMLFTLATVRAADEVGPPVSLATSNPDQGPAVSHWPIDIPIADGHITVFQPQLEDFQGDTLKGRAAVEVTRTNQTEPIYGAIWLQSRVSTDRVARTVQILDTQVTRTNFPNLEDPAEKQLAEQVRQAISAQPMTLSLDEVLAMLETVQREQQMAGQLDNTPPKIVFRDHPTVKIQYDGQPKLMAVENSNLLRVVNTPFFVVLDPGSKMFFLKGGGRWFSAPDPLGPWQNATNVPQPIQQLADNSDYKDPEQPIPDAELAGLEIMTATEPTELIWTDGAPQMGTITGTSLLYYTNTDSDVFMTIGDQKMYVLLSGRWFTAANRNGPWTYIAPDQLPDDFKRIPPNSDKGDVLAQVAGTQAAEDAVADTSVPQTATLDRHHFDQPDVQYDGDPQFEPVDRSMCSYASNCATPVVRLRGMYYCCSNAAWYCSQNPTGPWDICTNVPPDIYTLPPSCPIYSVRYCYVYGYTPDVVYVGYLPGYVGCYPYSHVVVFGTGYRYHPWFHHRFIPRPHTWGFAAHYNSYVGHWGFSFALATGAGSVWIGSGPHSWGRVEPWFGYGGYRPVVLHRDVNRALFRTEYVARIHEGRAPEPIHRDRYARNLYENRHDVRWEPGHAPGPIAERRDISPHTRIDSQNDIMIDRSGNIYRRTSNGWERRDRNQWEPLNRESGGRIPARSEPNHTEEPGHAHEPQEPTHRNEPAHAEADEHHETRHNEPHPQAPAAQTPSRSTPPELDREYHARQEGEQRYHQYERPSAAPSPSHDAGHSEAPHTGAAPSGGGSHSSGGAGGGGGGGSVTPARSGGRGH